MKVNCPACKRAHGDLAPGDYQCECKARFRVEAQANPAKWSKKHCAICRASFSVHPSAKTVDTKTRCAKCRKAMVEARQRERGLAIDYTGRRGQGWKGLKPIDITTEANPKKNPASLEEQWNIRNKEMEADPTRSRMTARDRVYKALGKAAERMAENNYKSQLAAHLKKGRKKSTFKFSVTPEHKEVVDAMPKVLSKEMTMDEAMSLLHQHTTSAQRLGTAKNPEMTLDAAIRAAHAWARKSSVAAYAHTDGYLSGAYQYEAAQMGTSEIEQGGPYILANLGTWRGEEAREAKKVIKQAIADARKKGKSGIPRNPHKNLSGMTPNGDWDNEEDYDEGGGHVCMKCGTHYPCTMEDGACEHHNDVCPECRYQSIYRQVEREMDSEDYQGPNPVKSGRGRYIDQAWMLYPSGMPIPTGWEKVGKKHTQGKRAAQPRPGMIWIIRKKETGTRRGLPLPGKKNPHTPMHLAPKPKMAEGMEGLGDIPTSQINVIGAAAGGAVAQRIIETSQKLAEILSRAPADASEADKAKVEGHLQGLEQSIGIVDDMLLDGGIAKGLQDMKASGSMDMAQLERSIEQRLGGMGDAPPSPMTVDPGTRRELGFALPKARRSKSKKASSRPSREGRQSIGFQLENPVKLPKTFKGPAGGHGQAYAYLDALHREYQEKWDEDLKATARKKRLHKKLLDWLKPHMPHASHVHLPKFIAHWMGDSPGAGYERSTWQRGYERRPVPALAPA